jgi:hypothetical protein
VAFDAAAGSKWSEETFGAFAPHATQLCFVVATRISDGHVWLLGPDDYIFDRLPKHGRTTVDNARRRRISSLHDLATLEQSMRRSRISAPSAPSPDAELQMVQRMELHAVQSVLMTSSHFVCFFSSCLRLELCVFVGSWRQACTSAVLSAPGLG